MSDVLFGKCPICGKEAVLDRTYFYYNIYYQLERKNIYLKWRYKNGQGDFRTVTDYDKGD